MILGASLFAALAWVSIDIKALDLMGRTALTWVVLPILGAILGIDLACRCSAPARPAKRKFSSPAAAKQNARARRAFSFVALVSAQSTRRTYGCPATHNKIVVFHCAPLRPSRFRGEAFLGSQSISLYAGSVRKSTYSPVVISSKSFAAFSYVPVFHASSPTMPRTFTSSSPAS